MRRLQILGLIGFILVDIHGSKITPRVRDVEISSEIATGTYTEYLGNPRPETKQRNVMSDDE